MSDSSKKRNLYHENLLSERDGREVASTLKISMDVYGATQDFSILCLSGKQFKSGGNIGYNLPETELAKELCFVANKFSFQEEILIGFIYQFLRKENECINYIHFYHLLNEVISARPWQPLPGHKL